ncbi:hypothetical protein TcasGA2_TC015536 [Tribolium castaneum]|uniref:Proteasome activator PA28 N-terminal domain-containing protein n=1 Tax=Tribolium castaneum TaxID=7070 RepID=D2A5G8_TRICA|nr:hypothetical protein TcasGA2_TC015536 [Tribolium castaneum]
MPSSSSISVEGWDEESAYHEVLEYKDSLKKEAEELLLKGFPATIVKLNALLETPQFKNRKFTDVHQELNIPHIARRHQGHHHHHHQHNHRPPVVILSGLGNSKEVPGLVFGFDINEQLLSEDNNKDFCCDDFIARYVAPETYTATSHNHDKIVSFIGAAWEEALVNLSNGKVQYYNDLL